MTAPAAPRPPGTTDRNRISEMRTWEASSMMTATATSHAKAIVIPLPRIMFNPNSVVFNDMRYTDPRAIPHIQCLQYWLNVLDTAKKRYDIEEKDFPVEVFLETLRTQTGNVVEYRMYIFEKTGATHRIADIYYELAGVKPPASSAPVVPGITGAGPVYNAIANGIMGMGGADMSVGNPLGRGAQGIQRPMPVQNQQGRQRQQQQQPDPLASTPIRSNELWRYVKGLYSLRAMEAMATSRAMASATAAVVIGDASATTPLANPFATYSLASAIVCCTTDGARGVCEAQRSIITYQSASGQGPITLDHHFGIYRVDAMVLNVDRFLLRQFPHVQFSPTVQWFANFINTIKRSVVEQENRVLARRGQQNTGWVRDALYGADDHGIRAEHGGNTNMEEVWGHMSEANPEPDGYLVPNDVAMNIRKYTVDELAALQTSMDIPLSQSRPTKKGNGFNDPLSRLALEFSDYSRIISRDCELDLQSIAVADVDDAEREAMKKEATAAKTKRMEMLTAFIMQQYDKLIFGVREPGISKVMDTAQEEARRGGWFAEMESGEMEMICNFVELSPGANHFIKIMQHFKFAEKVTFHAPTAAILTVISTNCWVRDLDVPNESVILVGDAAGGKSYMCEKVIKNTCPEAWERITTGSRKAMLNEMQLCHMMQYNDDSTLMRYATSKDGEDAEHRQLMTTGRMKYVYTELEPYRHQKEVYVMWKGLNIECTNVGYMQILNSAPKDRQPQIEATLSRYWFINVNTHHDEYYSVLGSNSSGVTPENIDALCTKGRKFHSLMWLLCGYAHQMFEVLKGHKIVDMKALDVCIPLMMKRLNSFGIVEADNRQVPKIARWCMEWVIRRTILEAFFVCTGKYFKKPFLPSLLSTLDFVCTEEDVILAFSVFFPTFCPIELQMVVKLLRDMTTKSIDMRLDNISYGNPSKHGGRMPRRPVDDTTRPPEDPAPSSANHSVTDMLNQLARGVANNTLPRTAMADMLRKRQFHDESRAHGQARGQESRGSAADDDGASEASHESDRRKRQRMGGAAAVDEDDRSLFSYVKFEYNMRDLPTEIKARARNSCNVPSTPQLNMILKMLGDQIVETHQYYMKPVKDDVSGQVKMIPTIHGTETFQGRGMISKDGCTYINYEILFGTLPMHQLCESCIKAVEFSSTIPRKVLTCIPHADYSWLTVVLELRRQERKLTINNPRYIHAGAQITLTGMMDPNYLTPDQQQPFIEIDQDIDTYCIYNYLLPRSRDAEGVNISDFIMHMHPSFKSSLVREETRRRMEERSMSVHVRFMKYPDVFVNEYKAIRADVSAIANHTGGVQRMIKSSDIIARTSSVAIDDATQSGLAQNLRDSVDFRKLSANIENPLAYTPPARLHTIHSMMSMDSAASAPRSPVALPASVAMGNTTLFQFFMNADPNTLNGSRNRQTTPPSSSSTLLANMIRNARPGSQ